MFVERDRIKVVLVGHSLGGGAASIAAMELREHSDFLDVQVIGFGCPSLLSHELSESTKDYVLTVVNDADIVSRMSGASMTNILLDLVDYDWTHDALADLGYSLERAKQSFPDFASFFPDTQSTLEWFETILNEVVRPNMLQRQKTERLPSRLIPPGTCVHLFRDGYGVTGTYTPCNFFEKVEFSLTLIDDHLIATGYNRALLAAAQDYDRDYSVSTQRHYQQQVVVEYDSFQLICFFFCSTPISFISFNSSMTSTALSEYKEYKFWSYIEINRRKCTVDIVELKN